MQARFVFSFAAFLGIVGNSVVSISEKFNDENVGKILNQLNIEQGLIASSIGSTEIRSTDKKTVSKGELSEC